MAHRQIVRVSAQEIHLLLQLVLVPPPVVALQGADVLALGSAQALVPVAADAHVFLAQVQADDLGEAGGIILQNGAGAVRAAVLGDINFKGKIGLLGQHTVDGRADVAFLIVGGDEYRHQGLVHGLTSFASQSWW